MTSAQPIQDDPADLLTVFPGGGESGARIRGIDWSNTPLGPVHAWPQALKSLLRTLLHTPHPFFLFWGPELIQFYNDASLPILGERHPLAMGQRARDCWVDVWPTIGPQLHSVLLRGTPMFWPNVMVPLIRNGQLEDAWWSYSYSPAFDDSGAIAGVLDLVTETTLAVLRSKQLEKARESADVGRARLEQMFENAPALFAVLRGPTHVFEITNAAYRQFAGPRDYIGKGIGEVFPELEGQVFLGLLDNVFATGEAFVGKELPVRFRRHQGGDEEEAFVTFTYAASRDAGGEIDGVIVFGFDVTETVLARRKIEELASQQAQARERAEQAMGREQVLREEAERANRARDEFLAMLGHELRNPLAPIATATQLMRLRENDHGRERLVIERQVAHLALLVDDLLDVAKIASGKIELKRTYVELSELASQAIEIASPLLEQHMQHFTVDMSRTGLAVDADPVRITQAISNLLTNAVKYSGPRSRISLVATREGAEIVMRVTDDGPGIDPELLSRIFDIFVQGKRSIDRAGGGLGLGLALVKNIVELHDGSVSAANRPAGGAEFTVRLPAASLSERPKPALPVREVGLVRTPKRVLVVDDNVDAAELLADLLHGMGHEVVVAHDGPQALEALRSFPAEVGVLDIGLPVMDGYDLARRIRQLGAPAPIRLIALTGYGQDHDRERSFRAGFDIHLTKPVELDDITAAVEGA